MFAPSRAADQRGCHIHLRSPNVQCIQVDLIQMKQTNRASKFVRAIRVTGQGTWEWEEGSAGSGDWKPYGASEAAQLQHAYIAFKSSPQGDFLAPPPYWSPQANDKIVKYFDVTLDSGEAAPLIALFRKTVDDADGIIVKIERVQNLSLVGKTKPNMKGFG